MLTDLVELADDSVPGVGVNPLFDVSCVTAIRLD
jgi:hypothetical protein